MDRYDFELYKNINVPENWERGLWEHNIAASKKNSKKKICRKKTR